MHGKMKRKLSLGFEYKTVTLNYPIAEDGNYLEYCFDIDDIEYIKLYNYFDEMDCVYDIDTNVGMTEVVFYISFKYDAPDETIKELLENAIEMAWNNEWQEPTTKEVLEWQEKAVRIFNK